MLMNKPLDLDNVKKIIKIIRKLNLKINGFFILGYPGEDKEQMQKTVDYVLNIGIDWAHFNC